MDLREYFRVLRRRWILMVVVVVGAGIAAQGVTMLTTPRYAATSQLFVAVHGNESVGDLNQGNAFAQSRVASYVNLATSPKVLDSVAQATGISAHDLSTSITATTAAKTVLIEIRAESFNAKRAAAIANATADELVALVSELEATRGDAQPPVTLRKVQDAAVPTIPFEPSMFRNLAIGLLLGLAGGIGLALLVDRFDTRLRGRQAVENLAEASVLGAFVAESGQQQDLLLRPSQNYSARHEAFRQLRTHLQFANVDGGVRSVLVTSSIPGEGKSTTAANLAIVLGESGLRVLLVDADLRRPIVAKSFGLEGSVGLTTVLTGRISLEDAVQPVREFAGVSVLTAGTLPPNPSEMLASAAMERTLVQMRDAFDVIVIDSPPLVNVSDAGALATLVSGVLLVASADGRLHRDQLGQSLENLRFVNAKVFGLVLNRLDIPRGKAGYYGYGYQPEGSVETGRHSPRGTKTRTRRGAGASGGSLEEG
ncbi:polysaccharide biosynthesis tyrosine autokinase [Leifsonia aquatica]|uniref:polysaccharide biosynthesis tyrosine autokinase n=1 Tax=Leifsonia aquatica TaxID=144185 RepID=UPI000469ABB7|nr:polysaccharide biosynthesis tyrosine autokinase [Leifsonia aquatica]